MPVPPSLRAKKIPFIFLKKMNRTQFGPHSAI